MPGALVPQPHGGALRHGSEPGNTPGSGRPPSAVRAAFLESFAARLHVLEAIADGTPTERITVPLVEILKHAACPRCETPLEANDPMTLMLVSVEGRVSAKARDRTQAVDVMGKYGIGTKTEVSADDVRERLGRTLDVIRGALSSADAERLIAALRPVWA